MLSMATLDSLPNELLASITIYLEHPQDLTNLSLSSRRLQSFVKLDGWKAFLRGRFALTGLDHDARNAVHGLTTLHRAWERKALMARYVRPGPHTVDVSSWKRKRWSPPRGQTMGYQPRIDSYDEMRGGWTDRREVLAWSAGTAIALRVKETGSQATELWEGQQRVAEEDRKVSFDISQHANSWYTYHLPESWEGRDDITALKLLRPHQKRGTGEDIVYGTASGRLALLDINCKQRKITEQAFDTKNRAIGGLSISFDSSPKAAVTLGDTSLALYSLDQTAQTNGSARAPLSEITAPKKTPDHRPERFWSCNFLSSTQIVTGLGPSYEPIHIYDSTPTGILPLPTRVFNFDSSSWSGLEPSNSHTRRSTSVYPIEVLPSSNTTDGISPGSNIFLSGGYDSIVRLHDIRSPRGFESMFWDMTNDSAIFSLASQGLERFIAGTCMHSMVKVFDLRLPGTKAYHTLAFSRAQHHHHYQRSKKADKPASSHDQVFTSTSPDAHLFPQPPGWNLFLSPSSPPSPHANRRSHHHRPPRRPAATSPIYSLSLPSHTSPTLYAGLEATLLSTTFTSVDDAFADPLVVGSDAGTGFRAELAGARPCVEKATSGLGDGDDDGGDDGSSVVLNLGMYEQQGAAEGSLGMQLVVQADVAEVVAGDKKKREGEENGEDPMCNREEMGLGMRFLDARWRDPRAAAERWERGMKVEEEREMPIREGKGRRRGRGSGGGGGRGRRGRF